MRYKRVFDRMIHMEQASARNPNLMMTYKVMWEALKNEIQFDKLDSVWQTCKQSEGDED